MTCDIASVLPDAAIPKTVGAGAIAAPKKQNIVVPSERFPGRLQVLQDAVVPEGKS